MARKTEDIPTEKELLDVAIEFLTREYQDDPRFIRVDSWRECGEFGLWLCVLEEIESAPEEFMSFELCQKIVED